MLQQTQVKTVIPYFIKFVTKIPSLKALSQTTEKKILKLWEGLGYYRRAKNLLKTARILIKSHKGKIPKKIEEIIKLPGVGTYTSNSLLAIIHNKPNIPIDGNVKRVFSRLFHIDINNNNFNKELSKIVNKLPETSRNGDLAEALMEFGAMICKPQNPLCEICNLKKYCSFFKKKNIFPLNKRKKFFKKKLFYIYCYLNKKKKIALTKNKNLGFLNNFNIPEIKVIFSKNILKKNKWNYLCKYSHNISNIKMIISLFYKFTEKKPKNFFWYSINDSNIEFIPSFTKKIFRKVEKLYK